MLKIKSLSKTYEKGIRRVEAVKNLTINVEENEFIALVGPSGCGKSTLLKIIAGILKPTKGEVFLEDKRITTANKNIGVVFQDFSLFPWLTVRENIEFGLKVRKVPEKERKEIVDHYLNATNLKDFADLYPKSLSGGMKQRVAIARTLANSPKIILMDEPFGSLDNLTRSSMQKFLTNLWEKDHKTIIFVTHDIEEAIFLADKIYVLSKNPAQIISEWKIPFERPRLHELKSKEGFFILKNKIDKAM